MVWNLDLDFQLYLSSYRQSDSQNLLDQLRELKDENGRLFKLLEQKDFEIKYLKKKREEDHLALACRCKY